MRSQWDCLRRNLGCWQGSFATYDPAGQWQSEIPSVVSLTETERGIRQEIRLGDRERVLEFATLSRQVLFFENGDFCQASLQFAPVAEFGIEFGFLETSERLRLVPLFQGSALQQITLIAEHATGTNPQDRLNLPNTDLSDQRWQQQSITLYPDWRSPDPVHYREGPLPEPTLVLPRGATLTYPIPIPHRQPFAIAAGWHITPQHHRRLICTYDGRGGWESCTQVSSHR
jgi:hypothetical protein